MHSIRSLLLVTGAILGFAVLAPPASAAAFVPFTLTKTCVGGSPPTICTISASSIPALIGAKIYYYGSAGLPGTLTFLSSMVVIVTIAGDTASGYCNVYSALPSRDGMCAFHDGSGALADLQAVAKVTRAAAVPPATQAVWSWIGEAASPPAPPPGP